MKSSPIIPFAVLAASFGFGGCASPNNQCARLAPTAPTINSKGTGQARANHAPFGLDYKLSRGDTVLLSGQSDFDVAGSANIDETVPRDTSERLRVNARDDDGRINVSIEYKERTGEGRELFWSPSLSLAPGSTGSVKLDLAGGEGRTVVVRVRPAEKANAAPAPQVVSQLP